MVMEYKKSNSRVTTERGSVFTELALSLPVILLVSITITQFCVVALHAFALQFSAERAAREGAIWPRGEGASYSSREEAMFRVAQQVGSGFGVSLVGADVEICPLTTPGCGLPHAGGSGDYFKLSLTRELPLFLGKSAIPFTATAIGKSEP